SPTRCKTDSAVATRTPLAAVSAGTVFRSALVVPFSFFGGRWPVARPIRAGFLASALPARGWSAPHAVFRPRPSAAAPNPPSPAFPAYPASRCWTRPIWRSLRALRQGSAALVASFVLPASIAQHCVQNISSAPPAKTIRFAGLAWSPSPRPPPPIVLPRLRAPRRCNTLGSSAVCRHRVAIYRSFQTRDRYPSAPLRAALPLGLFRRNGAARPLLVRGRASPVLRRLIFLPDQS